MAIGHKMARVWRVACLCAWIAFAAMPDHANRVLHVQELQRLAGAYGVNRVRDNAGRQERRSMRVLGARAGLKF